MADQFAFSKEHTTNWGESAEELKASLDTYGGKYFTVKGSKSEYMKGLGKNLVSLKDDIKADYRATQYKQRSRLLKSKGLGWESHSLRDVRKILTHAFQKGWELGVDICLKEWDEDDMTDEDRAASLAYLHKFDAVLASKNKMYNHWYLSYDDNFVKEYYQTSPPLLQEVAVRCCPCCKEILGDSHADDPFDVKLDNVLTAADTCPVCNLLVRAVVDDTSSDGIIKLVRTYDGLRAGYGGRRLVRFCVDPNFAKTAAKRPLGRPIPVDSDRAARFNLLRAWLRWCDECHECNDRLDGKTIFPTRVLDIGGLADINSPPGWVKLIHAEERKSDKYITLSHCWGNLSETQKQTHCTSQENIGRRQQGFHVSELPKTFQDAVKVARAIGVPYLWIDSLCIIQYGDGGEDWRRESVRMKSVYQEAYCSVSAVAAVDSYSGFLDRQFEPEHVRVRDDHGKEFFVSTDIDDYDGDNGNATLNTRAWVVQEAVLARRKIHFTSRQMYWTCGKGIYCENLTRLKSPPENTYFTLDPLFPTRLIRTDAEERPWNCISFLIEGYSKRALTFERDRKAAIHGLEECIAEAICCESRFGIFQRYIHRNLLWQATGEKVRKIQYDAVMPSWSWMARTGGVQFLNIEYGELALNKSLSFDKSREEALSANLGAFINCRLESDEEGDKLFVDESGINVGWIKLDVKDGECLDDLYCIVVGKEKKDKVEGYYVLAVLSTGTANEYRRVGLGAIECRFVVKIRDSILFI